MRKKSAILIILSILTIFLLSTWVALAETEDGNKTKDGGDRISIIFTHDIHSHMELFPKLKTVIDDIKSEYPDSLVLDGGDFAMGTTYQTIFSSEASEMKLMKYMGYDATTFGNHEFDYRATGLAGMLNVSSGYGVPVVCANIDWNKTLRDKSLKKDARILKEACDNYGVKDYLVIENKGVKVGVFGIMGYESIDFAPESGLLFKDPLETAKKVVAKIKDKEDVDAIVCLSHSGTTDDGEDVMEETEDYILAETVPGIDVIISGHSHTILDEEVVVGDTHIVSCGSYNENAGHIVVSKNGNRYTTKEYELIPLNESVADNTGVEQELKKYKNLVDEKYFKSYGYTQNQILVRNHVEFTDIDKFALEQGEDSLGSLLADSYKYAVAKAENGRIKGYSEGGAAWGEVSSKKGGAQVTAVPAGVIRASFAKGDITVADTFNVLSLGYGKDGKTGYPLVRIYLTGKELKAAAEVDASVSNFMGTARLYTGGLEYSWNPKRLILNRAVDVRYNDGVTKKNVDNDKLYSVIADLYSCQMLGSVNDKSFGLLEIRPKNEMGKTIKNYENHIIYDGEGNEIKAWYALASYIDSFEGNEIPQYYAENHNRKVKIDSLNPVELFKQPNKAAGVVALAAVIIILIIIGIVVVIRKLIRRHSR